MVRNKREVLTPGKRTTLTKKQKILDRSITKVVSRPNSATIIKERTPTANIKVIVRVRPPNNREESEKCRQVVKVIENDMLIFDPEEEVQGFFFHGVQQKGRDLLKKAKKNMKFYFDRIYSPASTNFEIFEGTTKSLINSIMDGYNCSVFAYGATGAGKTFTMTGTADKPGITFLTMTELFKKQAELAEERDFEIGITYIEVYNELVKDLLNLGPPLNLREDSNYGVIVAGIKVFKVSNENELFLLLEQGNRNRTQHPTDSNAESSRSHAVFQVYFKMTMKKTKEVRTAKLSMIDLAGSERGSATGCAGARFTEGANINKSLLALGNCINSLADGHRHVPYRDSKLTRLLKDCLGGNCQTVMIANISPAPVSFDDTYNTLKYATRANSIKANVHRNVTKADLNVMQYVKLLEELTKENESVKQELQGEKEKNETLETECAREKEKNETLETECARLKVQLENSTNLEDIQESLVTEIKTLAQRKRELLERRFLLERNESCTALRRLVKEDIENRLSDICTDDQEKEKTRDKIISTITRFKKQESVFRDDIEKAEDITDEIDKRFDELVMKNPKCKQLILNEKLQLDLQRSEHRILLEQKHCNLLIEEQEEKAVLMEKMASTLRNCFKLLQGHGYATPNIAKDYKDIVEVLQGRKNIKWREVADSGISSMTSIQDNKVRKSHVKRKMDDSPELNRTFSTSAPSLIELDDINNPKMKNNAESLMATGSKNLAVLHQPTVKLATKSPRTQESKEILVRKPFEATKSTLTGTTRINHYGVKGVKTRPVPLLNRPRFRR